MKKSYIHMVMMLVALFSFGCAAAPKILTKREFDSRSKRLLSLSSFHRDYLGSDDQYHYVRIGIATGDHDYRISRAELAVKDEYPYVATNPRIEALLPRLPDQMR